MLGRPYSLGLVVLLSPLLLPGGVLTEGQERGRLSALVRSELEPIIPDFQVNENAGPRGATQSLPAIAINRDGDFMIVWVDRRNARWDVYGQAFSRDGSPVGPNFKVNGEESAGYQSQPAIASDGGEKIVIVWFGVKPQVADIYARRYTIDGVPLGEPFEVSDDDDKLPQLDPDVAMTSEGDFVIVWTDERDGPPDIYAQIYTADGTPVGSNFRASRDAATKFQNLPAVATGPDGNFVLVWQDGQLRGRLGTGSTVYNIFGQRYLRDGTPDGELFRANEIEHSVLPYSAFMPTLVQDDTGNFLVMWWDKRETAMGVYAQRFAEDGTRIGNNIRLTDDRGGFLGVHLDAAMFGREEFLVVWRKYRDNMSRILMQRYFLDGTLSGNTVEVSEAPGGRNQAEPVVAVAANRAFVVSWRDDRTDEGNIVAQRFDSSGVPQSGNFTVNDDRGSSEQRSATVAVEPEGGFVVAWLDDREAPWDVFVQRYTVDGKPLGSNLRVNDLAGSVYNALTPPVVLTSREGFVVMWADKRDTLANLYAQRFASDGSPLGDNFRINDAVGQVTTYYNFDAAISTTGDFMVTWIDRREGKDHVYAQLFAKDGTAIGANVRVNGSDAGAAYPAVTAVQDESFVIVWTDYRSHWGTDIYAQRFASSGEPLATNFRVNDPTGGDERDQPDIASDATGRFVIVWSDRRRSQPGVYAQWFQRDGQPNGRNFLVSEPETRGFFPSVHMDASGDFVVVWIRSESEEPWSVFGQRYFSDRTPLGGNFRLEDLFVSYFNYPGTDIWNNRMYNVWSENRGAATGLDIWAHVLDLQFDRGRGLDTRAKFLLWQNYPNPFNAVTNISYTVKETSSVTLAIYDLLGNHVETLADGLHEPDTYTIQWRPQGLASGLYIARLQVGNTVIGARKLLLVR